MLALGLQRIFRAPKAGDVVVNFLLGRNFDELNRTFAPVADRLGPQARALFEAQFKILIREKILLPLHQAEAAGIVIGESADLQIPGIVERTPEFFAAAVIDRHAVGIVHRRTKVIDVVAVVRSEEEHARHWHQAGMVESDPRIDGEFHIEDSGVAGPVP